MTTAVTPKGERRRHALVEAASELLLEGGFDAVRHRSVATRARLPLASTTYYFESLDELIACAVEFTGAEELTAMRDRVHRISHRRRGPEATVDLMLDLLVSAETDESAREHLIARYERFVASARHPELRAVQRQLRAQIDELLAEVIRRCGRITSPEQVRRLAGVVDGAVVGALSEADPDPRGTAREALLEIVDVVAPQVDR
ncbi:TetR/AcrR family transcriptional regulator [Skermania piniformis]|uniref:TetR family transcriptional regulator C-terminal domain-containing protein n=1 Tax=Skermania pinensis TaxID=39122 RepID=A0ABX8S882_9ACTN|nr:TetR family transcriptional regulator C-terminal domain-containing protein [Skermania piniformis]QXQ13491.1 TetR family transcriptional regulator C-terminal domain-containing protein [Skermania piniformis]